MGDLDAGYASHREDVRRQEMLQWYQGFLDKAPDAAPTPQPGAAAAPKPPDAAGFITSVGRGLKAGVAPVKDTFVEGATNFVKGLSSGGGPGRPVTSPESLQAHGQTLLGALQLVSALPAGAGAAFEEFLKSYSSKTEKTQLLPGGRIGDMTLSGHLRTILELPGLTLDPKVDLKDPAQVLAIAERLNEPLTVGQLGNLLVQFVVGGRMAKAVSGKAKASAPGAEPAPAPVAGAATPKAGVEPVTPTRVPAAAPAEPASAILPSLPDRIQAAVAAAKEASAGIAAQEGVPRNITPMLPEQIAAALDAARPSRQAERAVGSRYTPDGAPAVSQEPFRANQPVLIEPAEGPLLSASDVAGARAEALRPGTAPTALETALKRAESLIGESLASESGAVSLAVQFALARMAAGAVAGGAVGDTPEDRVRNALVGAGVGLLASGKLAKSLTGVFREQGIAAPAARASTKGATGRSVMGEEAFQPNYGRIDASGPVKDVMREIHRRAEESILDRRGPARGHGKTGTEAERMIQDGAVTPDSIIGWDPDHVPSGPEGVAARYISEQSAEHVMQLRDRILGGEALPEGTLRNAEAVSGVLARNVRVGQTRQGQALEANKIKVPGGIQAKYRPEDITRIVESMGREATDAELASALVGLKAHEISRAGTMLSVVPRAIMEAAYFGMLSGKALIRNLAGNVLVMPLGIAERTVAPYLPRWGKPGPGVYPGEGFQMLHGAYEGFIEQMRLLRHFDEFAAQAEKMGTRKIEGKFAPAVTAANFDLHGPLGWAVDRLGTVLRLPGEIMAATDGAAKAVNGRSAHYVEAFRQAKAENLAGDALWARRGELLDDYTQLSPTALKNIQNYRDTMTFTKDFEGRLLSAIQAGPQNPWMNMAYSLLVAPFRRTPIRIAEFAANRTPGLNMLMAEFWRDMSSSSPVRAQMAQARMAVGAITVGSFLYLAMQGAITGSGPTDAKNRALWEKAGFQPRSFWDPVSEKWRSYDGMEPVATLVSEAADLAVMLKNLPNEADRTTLFFGFVLSQINNFDSKTYTMALSDIFNVLKPGTDSQVEALMDLMRKRAAMFAPAALREVEIGVDPTTRRTTRDYSEEGTLAREWLALKAEYARGIPGWSTATDAEGNALYPPARDPLSAEPEATDSWPLNPATSKKQYQHPVYEEMWRLAQVTQQTFDLSPPKALVGTVPRATVGLAQAKSGWGVGLTPQEQDRFVVIRSTEVEDGQGRKLAESLHAMIQSDLYLRQSDIEKGNLIRSVWHEFDQRAEDAIRKESELLDRAAVKRTHEREIQKAPPESQPMLRERLSDMQFLRAIGVSPK